jgi:hypothetical protein
MTAQTRFGSFATQDEKADRDRREEAESRKTEAQELFDSYDFDFTDTENVEDTLGDLAWYVEKCDVFCGKCGTGRHVRVGVILAYGKVTVACERCGNDLVWQLRDEHPELKSAPLLPRPVFNVTGTRMGIARDALNAVPRAEAPHHRTFIFNDSLVTVTGEGKITVLSAKALRVVLSEVARFKLDTGRFTDAPFDTATAALNLTGEVMSAIPGLEQVVTVPVLMSSGDILSTPGYNAAARTFYARTVSDIEVPDVVTIEDVKAALALILDELLVDFPFVSKADMAHALALMLLGFVRDLIDGPTPLSWIGAPDSRTGKGKLASCCLAPAFGVVSASQLSDQESERRKKISTELSKAVGAIKWDNVRGDVRSPALESALTESRWNDRKLGFNSGETASIDVPISVVWVLTANNATPGGDMRGRTVPINLDREVEDVGRWMPENGWHLPVPPEVWALEHRAQLATACLTLCRYWWQQGQPGPAPSTAVMGGYEEWTRVIGGILHAAGVEGFLGNLASLDAADDDKDLLGQVFRALFDAYGDEATTAATILADGHLAKLWSDTSTPTGMGMKLRSHKDKRADGLVLRLVTTRKANAWRIMEA